MAKFDPVTGSRAVLIEVANVLGAFRGQLVLIGGWVPEVLFPNRGHIGSLDVDFAVSPSAVATNAYGTILKRMLDAGYSHQIGPVRFEKSVAGVDQPVKVDLVSGQYQADESATVLVNELPVNALRGIDLAFSACDEMEIAGTMPDGSQNSVRLQIVRPEAYILIKAFALDERLKEKDAYDIAFVVQNHQSLDDLAKQVRKMLTSPLARDALQILQDKFSTIASVGPVGAAKVFADQGADYEQALRAAFEDAQELLRLIGQQIDRRADGT